MKQGQLCSVSNNKPKEVGQVQFGVGVKGSFSPQPGSDTDRCTNSLLPRLDCVSICQVIGPICALHQISTGLVSPPLKQKLCTNLAAINRKYDHLNGVSIHCDT